MSALYRRRFSILIGAIVFPIVGLSRIAFASTDNAIVVNSLSDDGTTCNVSGTLCLRDAITQATFNLTATTITFSTFGTITLTTPLTINNQDTNPITIDASGHTVILDGAHKSSLIRVNQGSNLILQGITISHGQGTRGGGVYNVGTLLIDSGSVSDSTASRGGGIYNGGHLTINSSVLAGDSSVEGGAIYNNYNGDLILTNANLNKDSASTGGAVFNDGSLLMIKGLIETNNADDGGGLYTDSSAKIDSSTFNHDTATSGGGVRNDGGDLTITNTTFSGNQADQGGGVLNDSGGNLSVLNSTFNNNAATTGGGLQNYGYDTETITNSTFNNNVATNGGALYNSSRGSLVVSNSTLSGNKAMIGAGLYNSGSGSMLTFSNSTIVSNVADVLGGGAYTSAESKLNVLSSIVADNIAHNTQNLGPDVYGLVNSLGHNMVGNTVGALGFGVDDEVGIGSTLLGKLIDNGGATHTHSLMNKSPALGQGDCNGDTSILPAAPPVKTDQRGVRRKTTGSGCDVGAFELNQNAPLPTMPSPATVPPPTTPGPDLTPTVPANPNSNGLNS